MGNPLNELRRLVSESTKPIVGKVVATSDTTVYVQTANGVETYVKVGDYKYAEGDNVRIVNGAVVGKVTDDTELPTYFV